MAGTLRPVEDVALGNLEKPLPHQLLLNHILHVLDMNEGAIPASDAGGHRARDLDGALGILFGGQKRLAARDFDFAFIPRHDRTVAADQANEQRGRNFRAARGFWGLAGNLDGPFENEAFGNVVRVIFNESFFDQQREIVFRQFEAMALPDVVEKPGGNGVGDVRNERAILFVENVFLLA